MKIKVLRQFYDREADYTLREEGEIVEVTDKRGKLLISRGFAMKAPPDQKERNHKRDR